MNEAERYDYPGLMIEGAWAAKWVRGRTQSAHSTDGSFFHLSATRSAPEKHATLVPAVARLCNGGATF